MRNFATFTLVSLAFSIASPALAQWQVESWISTVDGKQALASQEPTHTGTANGGPTGGIVVDPSITRQPILGMGGSLEHSTAYNITRLSPEKQNEVLEAYLHPDRGIGMNLMRICIGTSDFTGDPWYSYSDPPGGETDPELKHFSIEKDRAYLLPIIQRAKAINPDLLFFASPWSPPAWMKSTGKMTGGKLKPEFYGIYAQYLVKFIQAYEAEGVPIHAITPQNEPDYPNPRYPTCKWTGAEQRDFIRDHLGPALKAAGLKTEIWCWDHNWNLLEFPRTVFSDPEAAQYVQGVGFHHYEGDVEAQSTFHAEFPHVPIYFTEGSTFGTRGAVRIADIFRNHGRSYNAWVLVLDEHQKPNNGPHNATATAVEVLDDLSVRYNFDYYMYGHFTKFVSRNAVRIESTREDEGVVSVAFQNPDGAIIAVLVNNQREARNTRLVVGEQVLPVALPERSVATYRFTPSGG